MVVTSCCISRCTTDLGWRFYQFHDALQHRLGCVQLHRSRANQTTYLVLKFSSGSKQITIRFGTVGPTLFLSGNLVLHVEAHTTSARQGILTVACWSSWKRTVHLLRAKIVWEVYERVIMRWVSAWAAKCIDGWLHEKVPAHAQWSQFLWAKMFLLMVKEPPCSPNFQHARYLHPWLHG